MKNFLKLMIASCVFLSCEDTKKEKQSLDVKKQVKEEKVSKEVKATIKDTTAYNFNETVKLNNNTLETFLTAYGKNNPEKKVKIETSYGEIVLELYEDTPLHRAHFIYLIKNGYLSTTAFHRTVKDFIIQGGNNDTKVTSKMRFEMGNYTLPAEIKYQHNRGALSASKEYRNNPDDRSSAFEFFIVQSHNGAHHLNKNYTVFGKVISGMNVVDKIADLETDGSEWPLENVLINAVILD